MHDRYGHNALLVALLHVLAACMVIQHLHGLSADLTSCDDVFLRSCIMHISRMVYGIAIRLAGMKALAVI